MQVEIQQLRKYFSYEIVVKDLNFFVGPTHQKINLASSSVEQKTTSGRLFFGKKMWQYIGLNFYLTTFISLI